MLTVHHLGVSQSERIVWLCEELGVEYDLKVYDRDAETRLAPADYKALHPIQTAPIITDGAVVLGESGAIMEYIINRHGGGRLALAPGHPDYPHYLFWLNFANGSMMPASMLQMVFGALELPTDHPLVQAFSARGARAWEMVEQRLSQEAWFAGDEFTAADVMMGFNLTTMRAFAPHDLDPHPAIRAYLRRVGARPAYQRAMAKGDPGMTPMLS